MGLGLLIIDEDGNVISDNKDMAQVLNQYLSISPQFLQTRIWTIFQNRDVCAGTRIY